MKAAPASPWRWRLPTVREVWFQLHWFVGITAGTLLAVIGLTGAILARIAREKRDLVL